MNRAPSSLVGGRRAGSPLPGAWEKEFIWPWRDTASEPTQALLPRLAWSPQPRAATGSGRLQQWPASAGGCHPLPFRAGKENDARDSPASCILKIFQSDGGKEKGQRVKSLQRAVGRGGRAARPGPSGWGSPPSQSQGGTEGRSGSHPPSRVERSAV